MPVTSDGMLTDDDESYDMSLPLVRSNLLSVDAAVSLSYVVLLL